MVACPREPDRLTLSSGEYAAENCIDQDIKTYCRSEHDENETNPFLVIEYEKPVEIEQVTLIKPWMFGELVVIVTNQHPEKGKNLEGEMSQGSRF